LLAIARPRVRIARKGLLAFAALALASPAAAARGPAPESQAPQLPVVAARCQDGPDLQRLSFDWGTVVPHRVEHARTRLVITFAQPARIDLAPLLQARPRCVRRASARQVDAGVVVEIELPQAMEVRDAQLADRVVIDLFLPARRPAAEPPAAATATAAVETPAGPEPADRIRLVPEPPAEARPPSGPAPAVARAAASEPAPPAIDNAPVRFAWAKPVAAALFMRGASAWLVFATPSEQDTSAIRRRLGEAHVAAIEQRPHPRATVLRLSLQTEKRPELQRDGAAWLLSLTDAPQAGQPVAPRPESVDADHGRMLLPVAEPAEPIAFTDPDAGDNLIVVPLPQLGRGLPRGYDLAPFRLLPSQQGIAVQPQIDGLRVRSLADGIELTAAGGLRLSPVAAAVHAASQLVLAPEASRLITPEEWHFGDDVAFVRARADLLHADAGEALPARAARSMQLSSLYLSHGLAAETLGQLERSRQLRPELAEQPAFRLQRGIARLLLHRTDEAAADLTSTGVGDSDEGRLWQALVRGTLPAAAELAPARATSIVAGYPSALRRAAMLALIDAAITTGEEATAEKLITAARLQDPAARANAWLDYEEGRLQAGRGNVEAAVAAWDRVRDQPTAMAEPETRAALARLALLRREHKMPPVEAVNVLERLRTIWRGDDLELATLRELGRAYADLGDNLAAMRSWQTAVSQFGATPAGAALLRDMASLLATVMQQQPAAGVPAWKTVALYREFKELVPAGSAGVLLQQHYAQRLLEADLPQAAAEVLGHLLTTPIPQLERAQVGLTQAGIELQEGQPQAALLTLQRSAATDLPAELQRQRRLTTARALIGLKRSADALALLADDPTPAAAHVRLLALRAEGDWSGTAAALDAAPSGEVVPARALERALDAAAALTLANDRAGLDRLRDKTAELPREQPAGRALELVTRPSLPIAPTAAAVAGAVAEAEELTRAVRETLAASAKAAAH
jgi:hypothetical protein